MKIGILGAGPPADGWRFEHAKPACCVSLDAATREGEPPHGSWRT